MSLVLLVDEVEEIRQAISKARKKVKGLKIKSKIYDNILSKKQEDIWKKVEEVNHLEGEVEKGQKLITKLKLKGTLRDAQMYKVMHHKESHQKVTITLMEGHLLKMDLGESGGRLVKNYVWLEIAHQGMPILAWASDQISENVERGVLKSISSENQSFTVQLGIGMYLKATRIQFVEENHKVLKSWVLQIRKTLKAWKRRRSWKGSKSILEGPASVRELIFKSVPLGFGIAKPAPNEKMDQLVVSSIQDSNLWSDVDLQVGMVLGACNGKSLKNMDSRKAMSILQAALQNVSENNPVIIRFEDGQQFRESWLDEKHMDDLYPHTEANSELKLSEHPLLRDTGLGTYLNDVRFRKLCQELILEPKKLNEFLKRKDL